MSFELRFKDEEPTDVEKATSVVAEIEPIAAQLEQYAATLAGIASRNQNPGCGGDRKMSGDQWVGIYELARRIRGIEMLIRDFREAPKRPFLDVLIEGMKTSEIMHGDPDGDEDDIPF